MNRWIPFTGSPSIIHFLKTKAYLLVFYNFTAPCLHGSGFTGNIQSIYVDQWNYGFLYQFKFKHVASIISSLRVANPSNAGTSCHANTGPSGLQRVRAEDKKNTKWNSWYLFKLFPLQIMQQRFQIIWLTLSFCRYTWSSCWPTSTKAHNYWVGRSRTSCQSN